MPRPGKQEDVGLQLITVSRRYRRAMDAIFAENGLSDASTLPLRFLIRQGRPYRQKDLAEELDIEGPTLVRVLDTLVAQGLLKRAEDPGDRRAKLVTVTDEGHAYIEALADRLDALRSQIFSGIPQRDIDATLSLLSKLDANMERVIRSE
ncbi:MarR family winged helix-turn-helix transcriptional regulator [Salipiger sp. PrR002]|uniref:MarR family winged helix-turn-helix transcriptional regulator n=1 Tax=Salipiger sp. PrR002 TaxID=2706489 RepID=UPI0013BD905E|nr:MarR family transcriptional regulator [Salipiger sp. PrR002]NDW00186.1 winged helix DNA-binding protein [Salipiger sp. PrR002]NDW56805.1 winged helix DNA-binding protein [Salipiger sp. PrR004]